MNDAFRCPSCSQFLVKTDTGVGMLWNCPDCEGRAVSLGFLRRGVENQFLNQVWQQAREHQAAQKMGPRACPSCGKKMPVAILPMENDVQLVLDVCPTCHFVWLDHGEAAQMPMREAETKNPTAELSPAAKEAVALAQIEALSQRADIPDRAESLSNPLPEYLLKEIIRSILRHLRF